MAVSQDLIERNLLLRSLGRSERALLPGLLDEVELRRGDVLFEPGDDVTYVLFPCDGTIITLLVTMRDGRTSETATIGNEGAAGGVVSQGYLPAFSRGVVQVGGRGLRADAGRLQAAKAGSPRLRNALTRYADCLLAQVLQSVACNAVHSIEQRSARLLLTLHDRLGTDVLPLTQEMLAEMLGVRRTYLTGVLGQLQRLGLIEIARGRVVVRDRRALETISCECHERIRAHFAEVFGARFATDGTLVAVEPHAASQPSAASLSS